MFYLYPMAFYVRLQLIVQSLKIWFHISVTNSIVHFTSFYTRYTLRSLNILNVTAVHSLNVTSVTYLDVTTVTNTERYISNIFVVTTVTYTERYILNEGVTFRIADRPQKVTKTVTLFPRSWVEISLEKSLRYRMTLTSL